MVARLLAHADGLYTRAEAGVAALPLACRPAIHAALLFYAAIGREAGRPGFDPVSARAVVPGRRKAVLVLRALGRTATGCVTPGVWAARGVLPSVAALVDASSMPDLMRARAPVWQRAEAKAVWVLDLFATLEARERNGRAA